MQTALLVLGVVGILALIAWFLYRQMRFEELEKRRAAAAKKKAAGKEAAAHAKKGPK